MNVTELETKIAIMEKLLYGNGVKGLITKVEDLEDKLDNLEIYMEKNLMDAIKQVEEKIMSRRRFNITSLISAIGVLTVVVLEVAGLVLS